jgi:hypothetical protein
MYGALKVLHALFNRAIDMLFANGLNYSCAPEHILYGITGAGKFKRNTLLFQLGRKVCQLQRQTQSAPA